MQPPNEKDKIFSIGDVRMIQKFIIIRHILQTYALNPYFSRILIPNLPITPL